MALPGLGPHVKCWILTIPRGYLQQDFGEAPAQGQLGGQTYSSIRCESSRPVGWPQGHCTRVGHPDLDKALPRVECVWVLHESSHSCLFK